MSRVDSQIPVGTTARRAAQPMRARHVGIPLAIYAASRVVDSLLIAWASSAQVATESLRHLHPDQYFVHQGKPADPGILGIATNWDGEWYGLIATEGYGSPGAYTGELGESVQGRSWLFPPGYPMLVSAIMRSTHLGFAPAGVLLSILAGALAVVLIHQLVLPHLGEFGANAAIALTCFWASAPVFQMTYSEPLALAFLTALLLAIDRRRPWLAVILVLPLAFTRLITPPLALVVLACYLPLALRRQVPRAEMGGWLVLILASGVGMFLWTGVVLLVSPQASEGPAAVHAKGYAGGWVGEFAAVSPWAALCPLAVYAAIAWVSWSERKVWGHVLSAWTAFYCLFLLIGTSVTTGVVRYSLMAFPLSLILVGKPGQSLRLRWISVVLGCLTLIALQAAWIRYAVVIDTSARQPLGP